MIATDISSTPAWFPSQFVTDKQRTEKWKKDSMDGAINLALYNYHLMRKSKKDKIENYDIAIGKFDADRIKRQLNPLHLEDGEDDTDIFDNKDGYSVILNPLNTLFGEDLKRPFEPRAIVVNPEAVSSKERMIKDKIMEFIQEAMTNDKLSEEEVVSRTEDIMRWKQYSAQTIHEKMANSVLQYYAPKIDFLHTFNDGFKDLVIAGEEIYFIGDMNGEPLVRKCNPLYTLYVGSGASNRIEDSRIIVEYGYFSLNAILQEFNRDLTKKDIANLETYQTGTNNSTNFIKTTTLPYYMGNDGLLLTADEGIYANTVGQMNWYDRQGNILLLRVFWLSTREIAEIKYIDEFGDDQIKIMPSDYILQPNESATYFPINEWWQGVKLGKDIYLAMKPCDTQIRSISNPAKVQPPYVGIINNINQGKAFSIVDSVKEYAYDYIFYAKKLKHLWLTNLGKIAVINMSMIPTGSQEDGSKWDIQRWFKWARMFRFVLENPFEEDGKGRTAGSMNQNAREIDMSAGAEIEQCVRMLEYILQQINMLAGVSPQRQGDIAPSSGLGVTQQAVAYSVNQTEPIYSIHEEVKLRTLRVFLEYAKNVLKDKKELSQYILDDTSLALLAIDGTIFAEAEYDVQIVNSRKMQEFEQMMNTELITRAVQGNLINLSDAAMAKLSTSPTAMIANLRAAEAKKLKETQEQQKQMQQMEQQKMQQATEMAKMAHQFEMEKMAYQRETDMLKLKTQLEDQAKSEAFNRYHDDLNNNGIDDTVETDKQELINEQKDSEIEINKKLADDELKFKYYKTDEDNKTKLQIAHSKPKTTNNN